MRPQLVLSLLILSIGLSFGCKQKSSNNSSNSDKSALEQERKSLEAERAQIAAEKANIEAQRAAIEAERKRLEDLQNNGGNPPPIPDTGTGGTAQAYYCAINNNGRLSCHEGNNPSNFNSRQNNCVNRNQGQWYAGTCPATLANVTKIAGCRMAEGQNYNHTIWYYAPMTQQQIQNQCNSDRRTYVTQ